MEWTFENRATKIARLGEWHRWFAWFPVPVDENHMVWMEDVQRKGSYCGYAGRWNWEYKRVK